MPVSPLIINVSFNDTLPELFIPLLNFSGLFESVNVLPETLQFNPVSDTPLIINVSPNDTLPELFIPLLKLINGVDNFLLLILLSLILISF